ncbi:NAD(P)-dependent oxidoreductase [Sulfobacillus sp. hq2]|nr:NAD(P)-dependent oxidoreductase [Sulfobacillus sp. hq2]
MTVRMKHVIIGASGQVGGYLFKELATRHESVVGTSWTHTAPGLRSLNMEDEKAVIQLLDGEHPHVVWIPAALPDVDRCEREPDVSYRLNVQAPGRVAELAAQRGAKVVFFSTDYVFDGENGPYSEGDEVHPLQVYGRHKAEIENFLLSNVPRSVIIRPAWIYSQDANPRNFVYRVVQQLKQGAVVKAVTDQWNTPTPSDGLGKMAWQAVVDDFVGVLHVVGPERLSRYELTVRIARKFGFSAEQVEPVTTEAFHLEAQRPLNGGLITAYRDYRMEPGRDFSPVF